MRASFYSEQEYSMKVKKPKYKHYLAAALARHIDFLSDFGGRLKRLRRNRCITLKEMGDNIGCSYELIRHIEDADANTNLARLVDISNALSIDIEILLNPIKKHALKEPKRIIVKKGYKNTLCNALKDMREKSMLSQTQLAEILGVTQALVSFIELNKISISLCRLLDIAKALGYSLHIEFTEKKACL